MGLWTDLLLSLTLTAAIVPAIWVPGANGGNTTCASNQMEWYTSVVGETPCATYEKLRKICNPDYEVPSLKRTTPGDVCDDQVSSCCCNTVAFQLSMLCMNCQYDTEDGYTLGIDAPAGTYTSYRGTCGAGRNHTLPTDIQQAVCNKDLRVDDILYGGWDDGSWYYVYFKGDSTRHHATNNDNTFSRCPSENLSSNASTSELSSRGSWTAVSSISATFAMDPTGLTNSGANNNTSTRIAAIVGGVIGSISAVVLAGVIFLFWRRRKDTEAEYMSVRPYDYKDSPMTSVTPLVERSCPLDTGLLSGSPHNSPSHSPPPETSSMPQPQTLDRPRHSTPAHLDDNSYSLNTTYSRMHDTARHEDGGAILEFSRSPSGRLPPAYRSWGRNRSRPNLYSTPTSRPTPTDRPRYGRRSASQAEAEEKAAHA